MCIKEQPIQCLHVQTQHYVHWNILVHTMRRNRTFHHLCGKERHFRTYMEKKSSQLFQLVGQMSRICPFWLHAERKSYKNSNICLLLPSVKSTHFILPYLSLIFQAFWSAKLNYSYAKCACSMSSMIIQSYIMTVMTVLKCLKLFHSFIS